MSIFFEWLDRTMLIERMFGAGIYSLLLGYMYIQIRGSNNRYSVKKHLKWYLLLLCVLAFFYIPTESADLFRWREISSNWPLMSFSDFFSEKVVSSDTPVAYLMIYLCQRTGVNGVLPAVCAFIFYSNAFHIFNSTLSKYKMSTRVLAVTLLFFMSSGRFLETISGVRCMVAFSIIMRCIYDEIIENKAMWKSVIPYLLACLLHTAATPLVAIRLFALLFEKKKSFTAQLVNGIFFVGLTGIAVFYGGNYIDASITKANNYISGPTYAYIWEYLIVGLQLMLIIYLLYVYYKFNYEKRQPINDIARLLLLLSIIEVVLIGSYSIFHRFIAASTFLSIPLMAYVLENRVANNSTVLIRRIKVVSMFILLLACVRGNLCGFKFFLLY